MKTIQSLALALVFAASCPLSAGPAMVQNVVPPTQPPEILFGPGVHLGAHALFLTPQASRADDTWGGGINLDYFLNPNFGFQASGSWADPGTGETWHNYVADAVLRAPFESAHLAPYAFVGVGAIVEDDAHVLGRAGVGIELRPTAKFGIFADWCYNFPGGGNSSNKVTDYQMIRIGLKFGL